MKQMAHIRLITMLMASLCLFVGANEVSVNRDDKGTIYSPIGKRDPFKQPNQNALGRGPASLNPLDQFSIEQLSLRGILRDSSGQARAMFEDPDGKTYILHEGDTIGRERGSLSKILNSEVIVTEKTFNYLGAENLYEKVISLPEK